MILNKIFEKIHKYKRKKQWRKRNPENDTLPVNEFCFEHVYVGKGTYGLLNVIDLNIEGNRLQIGSYCSIAENVTFLLNAEHNTNSLLTYPIGERIFHDPKAGAGSKGNIIVADDVWIGYGAIIMSGITIGQGAIIAAGAVVTKNVPPYSIVGGNPAKVIRKRVGDDCVDFLMNVKISQLTVEDFREYRDIFENEVTVPKLQAFFSQKR